MRSKGNARKKNSETTDDFSITTILQQTGRFVQGFLSREQCDNTTASTILSRDLAPVPSTEISIERTALLWCYWHTLTVIEYMLCFCNPRGTDWNKWLPFACFVYSITPHTITRYTPYKMLFGRKASVPGQLLQKPTAVYNYDYVVNDVKRKLQECNELTRANLMQTKQNRFTQQTSRV